LGESWGGDAVGMGLAGLLALSTADSGMPTVAAARPFRWGWRCLGEQRVQR